MIDHAKIEKFPGVDHYDTTTDLTDDRHTRTIYTVKMDEFDQDAFTQAMTDRCFVSVKRIGDSNFGHLIIDFMDF